MNTLLRPLTRYLTLSAFACLSLQFAPRQVQAQEKDPLDLSVRVAEHLEPAIPRPQQDAEAVQKLAEL